MRICKRIIEELQINAKGEKPGRQQHIHNEHAQKSHSRTRGVAKFGNVTRTKGAKHTKSERHRGRERDFCVLQHPLDENDNITEKCTLALEWRTIVLHYSYAWT